MIEHQGQAVRLQLVGNHRSAAFAISDSVAQNRLQLDTCPVQVQLEPIAISYAPIISLVVATRFSCGLPNRLDHSRELPMSLAEVTFILTLLGPLPTAADVFS